MHIRVISNQGRKLTAYGLFSSFPDQFSAILEHPSGAGRQFLVSAHGHSAALDEHANDEQSALFFQHWKLALQAERLDSPAIRCLFYAAYEAASLIESLPAAKSALPGPLLWTFYPEFSLCFDDDVIHLAACDEAVLQAVLALLDQVEQKSPALTPVYRADDTVTGADTYKQAVERVKAYIGAGDIFQANIARFWSMPFDDHALLSLYHQLRQVNPAPFASFVRMDGLTLISASPERLFRMYADGEVDTRPIAGTRRRAEGEMDDSLRAELLLSEKERAEHIMLVDLERNDLGRVCRAGTVEVNERMVVEQYATVQHIVSNVRGRLQEGCDVVDLFRAMFPGGTITGCPKVRCMEIIHELEGHARGPYTGGVGYVAWDGSADMNILIRTFWHHQGALCWAAGAGIVADSDPEHELVETEHKVEGLLRAFSAR
ncbi:anthranilate synthase component I family protein [Mariprofundus erugo]|uniref:Anthranilate synthase component I family protein n=1 Tax=Mariprofundus erugo TaxID=2528639 RepID=A0A5R9GUV3_9PROT|nr:anthranilate synthase component I family protein [Mariprofundus erugo]TLS69238.1 anthranilate synthase component I family protein [Mariprofundus erugo]